MKPEEFPNLEPLVASLLARAPRMNFMQLCRLLEVSVPDRAGLGTRDTPEHEPVRFGSWPRVGFPAGEVAAVDFGDAADETARSVRPTVRTTFMGLYGVDSAVPPHMIDDIVLREEGHAGVVADRAFAGHRHDWHYQHGIGHASTASWLDHGAACRGRAHDYHSARCDRGVPRTGAQSLPESETHITGETMMSIRLAIATVASAFLLSACGAWQAVSDTSSSAWHAVFYKQVKVLNVDLSAREALNPDDAGRPTSVAVRIYQLRDRKLFDGASYDDLLKNDRTVLAQDLQDGMAAALNPGASARLSQPMKADTKYVAIVAFYRNPGNGNGWKYVIEKTKLDADKPLNLQLVDQLLLVADDSSRKASQ
ncbi:type VI secretion system lipoprotein TssJ [Paraburkholderia ferrariae]